MMTLFRPNILKHLINFLFAVVIPVSLLWLGLSEFHNSDLVLIFGLVTWLFFGLMWFGCTNPVVRAANFVTAFSLAACIFINAYEDKVYQYEGKFFTAKFIHEVFAFRILDKYKLFDLNVTNPYSKTKINEIVHYYLLNTKNEEPYLRYKLLNSPHYFRKDFKNPHELNEVEKIFFTKVNPELVFGVLKDVCKRIEEKESFSYSAVAFVLKKHFKPNDSCHLVIAKELGDLYER